jgi:hypothetical protein
MKMSPSDIAEVMADEDDFGHEMRVGSVLRSCPQAVLEHGGTYTDPVSHKPRQFDYRCWLSRQQARLVLATECKNISTKVPLVICGAARSENEAFHDLIESRQGVFNDGGIVYTGLSSVTRRAHTNDVLYPKDEFVGKSLLRIQMDKRTISRSGESEMYERWAQALSSGIELGIAATSLAKHLPASSILSAILPVVVVPDGTLWRGIYTENGALSRPPEPVEQSAFFVGREVEVAGPKGEPWYQTFTFSHIHFFTLTGLTRFLSRIVSDADAWRAVFVDTAQTTRVSAAYPRDPARI